MSGLRLTLAERARRFHRHLKCKTCGAQAGMPCLRMPAPKSATWRERTPNENPHQGRERTKERCGDTAEGGRHSSGCNLPPKHGGEWHYNRQNQRWRA